MRSRNPSFPADLLFGLAVVAALGVLLWAGRGLTFFYDEWELLLNPDPLSPGSLVTAHNDQLFIVPGLIYGLGLETFGMTSQFPYRLVTLLAALATTIQLYFLVRRRTAPSMAIMLVLPVLFLGAAWEALLLGLSMNFMIGMATGMGMLLAFDSENRRSDGMACLLLFCSLLCGGVGLAFLAGALVDLLVRRDFRRAWVPCLPLVLVAGWYLTQSGGAAGPEPLAAVRDLPAYLSRAAEAAIGAYTGLGGRLGFAGVSHLVVQLAVLALVVGTVLRLRSDGLSASKPLLVIVAILLAFWILGGLAVGPGRSPEASRYQYPAVVLLVAWIACLLDGLELPDWLPVATFPLVVVSVASNLLLLGDGRDFLSRQTEITRAALGQVEIEDDAPPYALTEPVTGSPYQQLIVTDAYLDASRKFGSPAFSPEQIESADPAAREAAAGVNMAAALARGGDLVKN